MVTVLLLGWLQGSGSESPLPLAMFERPGELVRWRVHPPECRWEATSEFALEGAASALFAVEAWREGVYEWPRFETDLGPSLTDWRPFTVFSFDAANIGDERVAFALILASDPARPSGSAQWSFALEPGEVRRFSVPVGELAPRTQAGNVRLVHLFVSRPAHPVRLVVDRFVLARAADPWQETDLPRATRRSLVARIDLAGRLDRAQRLGRSVRRGVDRGLADGLRDEERALERDVREATESPEAARALAVKIDELTARLERMRERLEMARASGGGPFSVRIADSMERIFCDRPNRDRLHPAPAHVELARGEVESFQLVVLPHATPLRGVRVERMELGPGVSVEAAPVAYVATRPPPYDHEFAGWWPEPIAEHLASVDVPLDRIQPFWVRVRTSPDATAGILRGSIRVLAEGMPVVEVPVEVEVWDFALPPGSTMPTAMSLARAELHRLYPGHAPADIEERTVRFLLSYRIALTAIYRGDALDPGALPEAGWAFPFNLLYVDAGSFSPGDPPERVERIVEEQYLPRLRPAVEWLRERGQLDRAYVYGFDERGPEWYGVIRAAFGRIRREFPGLRLMTTSIPDDLGTGSRLEEVVDAWVPLLNRYGQLPVEAARGRGEKVWWYICVGPRHPFPNWFIEYPAIEARLLMGFLAAKYRPDGFLYYALNRWVGNDRPMGNDVLTDWSPASYEDYNGDGCLFYAGPSGPIPSIRLENFRDGVEDYELFMLLEGLIGRLEARRGAQAVPRAYRDLLAVDPQVIRASSEFTRDPAVVREARGKLAEAIAALRRSLGEEN